MRSSELGRAALCAEHLAFPSGGQWATVGCFRPSFSCERGVRIRKEGVKTEPPNKRSEEGLAGRGQ